MTTLIADTFNGETQLSGYDSLLSLDPTDLAVVLANDHVDMRIMLQDAIIEEVTLAALDNVAMDAPLFDGDDMTDIEDVVKVPGENWTILSGTGVSAITVDKWPTYNDWRAIQAMCNGSTLNVVLDSTPPTSVLAAIGALDISEMDTISLVLDQTALTHPITVVTLALTSNVGGFGFGDDSILTLIQTGKEWAGAVSGITGSADLTSITGVRLTFTDDGTHHPSASQDFYVFALRAYQTGYDPAVSLDLNTRRGSVGVPVTFDLTAPTAGLATLIRGTGVPGDPTGQDALARMFVRIGSNVVASSGTPNSVDFIFREDALAGTYTRVRFYWWSTSLKVKVDVYDGGFTNLWDEVVVTSTAWTTLQAATYMVLEAVLSANRITLNVYDSNVNEQIGDLVYTNNGQTSPALSAMNGRMGWGAILPDRDAYLNAFDAVFTTIASGITQVFQYLSPIEALAISTASAADTNGFTEFDSFGGVEVTQDPTMYVDPATFSWASVGPVISNAVYILDSSESYIDFDIWIPAGALSFPNVVIRSPGLTDNESISMPPLMLQPNQWNHVHFELDEASQEIINLTCYLFIEGENGESMPYEFEVSNMAIYSRNVGWSARVNSDYDFRPFRDMTNAVNGQLHFPRNERGTELQISFDAFTDVAWVASFNVIPQYAPLGLPLYYRQDDQND